MIRIYINQKKNNLFLNIFYNNKNIYYNSIGKEGFLSKKISSPMIEFFINKMFNFLNSYIALKLSKRKFYKYKYNLLTLNKKKILIYLFLNILNSFDNYFISIINSKFKIKIDRIIFINKFRHGGCKFKKII